MKSTQLAVLGFAISHFGVTAADNIVINGDFEKNIELQWIDDGAIPNVVFDSELESNVLAITEKKFAYSTAKYESLVLTPGHTYQLELKLKSDTGSLGMLVTYRGDELTNAGDPKDSVITLQQVESEGQWVNYSTYFTLPADFDTSLPVAIKPKTDNGNFSDMYLDDIVVIDLGINSHVSDLESYVSSEDDYWTANVVNGKSLDVMRVHISDVIADDERLDTTASFADVDNYFSNNTDSGWRWPTIDELKAIRDFYQQDEVEQTNQSFLALNGNNWSPKVDTNNWQVTIPTQLTDRENVDIESETSSLFIVKEDTALGNVKYNQSATSVGTAASPLIVRDALTLSGGENITVEATAFFTDLTLLDLDFPFTQGGAIPRVLTADPAVDSLGLGEHLITWQVTDGELNVVSKQQMITLVDTTGPVFDALDRKTIESSGSNSVTVTFEPVNTIDAVDGEITAENNAESAYSLGCYDVIWTSQDMSGNVSSKIQKLQVIDDVECPWAIVSGPVEATERETITLSADSSMVDESLIATYNWSLYSGERLTVSGNESVVSFKVPSVDQDTLIQVQLDVNDGNTTDSTVYDILVKADPELVSEQPVIIVNSPELINEGNTLTLDLSSSIVDESLEASFSGSVISGEQLEFAARDGAIDIVLPDVEQDTTQTIAIELFDGINTVSTELSFVIQDTTPEYNYINQPISELEKDDSSVKGTADGGSLGWGALAIGLLAFVRRQLKRLVPQAIHSHTN